MEEATTANKLDRSKTVFDICGTVGSIISFFTPYGALAPWVLLASAGVLVATFVTSRPLYAPLLRYRVETRIFASLIGVGALGSLAATMMSPDKKPQSAINGLSAMSDQLAGIDKSAASIDRKMDGLAKETSDNPRKELANLGGLERRAAGAGRGGK